MNLKLESTQITNLTLEDFEGDKESEDVGAILEFQLASAFSNEDPHTFLILFKLSMVLQEGKILTLDFRAEFSTEDSIDDDFKFSEVPKVRAPIIAFPYVRSFVSTFLLNAGYEPAVLPIIDFEELYHSDVE
ncbi:protein-export chaperone SecB [Vibrio alginolyticus]|uniref:protein-export chaperone SecB n=1 Tax=Vibrio TaxID=662 RepID=UPI00215E5720|nr:MULTISPECIES: protein-export chaperone SecB [Vibrio]EJL6748760.1 protein-export chaperone SecB [Vibrio alginolyticus]EJN3798987.1 protein-export chaperone SecB [Vibrio alginolyticus]EJX2554055.1 protein-export chaperone SecB [Vibrio alginolyticus]EMA9139176.1 protein-export chaperone SecB [Vibrio alginolyticus]MCS0165187.1 protein-export chaperone SecB [Vibrio alginolyticus]